MIKPEVTQHRMKADPRPLDMDGPEDVSVVVRAVPAWGHQFSKHTLFGVPIHAMTMQDALCVINIAIERRERVLIGVVNAAKLVKMRKDPGLHRAVLKADLILADGMSVVWASRLLGRPVPERVTGIDLMEGMLAWGDKRHYRVYCLGASEKVLAETVRQIQVNTPGVDVVGSHHGYFSSEQESSIVSEIRIAQPDILLVGMSSPRKELFLARWAEDLDVPILHGVGGAFDVKARLVRRAPAIWQDWGLEWLYRVLQEPRRMWYRYLMTNTRFGIMLVGEWVHGARRKRSLLVRLRKVTSRPAPRRA